MSPLYRALLDLKLANLELRMLFLETQLMVYRPSPEHKWNTFPYVQNDKGFDDNA